MLEQPEGETPPLNDMAIHDRLDAAVSDSLLFAMAIHDRLDAAVSDSLLFAMAIHEQCLSHCCWSWQ